MFVSYFKYWNKNKLPKQIVKLLMWRLIRSRLIWISTICKCVSEFTWCPTLPYRVGYTCSEVELSGDETMCGSRGGDRGSGPPPPAKSQVIWISIEINKLGPWTPPRKVGPPRPLKSIVFSVIKPLDPLCKLKNKLRTKTKQNKKSCPGCVFWPSDYPPPPTPPWQKFLDPRMETMWILPKITSHQPMCVHRRIRVLRAPKLTLRSLDLEAI